MLKKTAISLVLAITSLSAHAGTLSPEEITQQQLGQTCQTIGKSVAKALGVDKSQVQADYDAEHGSCFITQGDETLVRIVADADGFWSEPY